MKVLKREKGCNSRVPIGATPLKLTTEVPTAESEETFKMLMQEIEKRKLLNLTAWKMLSYVAVKGFGLRTLKKTSLEEPKHDSCSAIISVALDPCASKCHRSPTDDQTRKPETWTISPHHHTLQCQIMSDRINGRQLTWMAPLAQHKLQRKWLAPWNI